MRRTPEEARTLALASARRLLLAAGPDAITLQAVATDLGMSHTNLIHHFGSAAGLQSHLMRQMMSELTAAIESAVMRGPDSRIAMRSTTFFNSRRLPGHRYRLSAVTTASSIDSTVRSPTR